jgi:L-fucose isomerase-like protein
MMSMKLKSKVGFIVFGVHKDGLLDPMGAPFIDDKLVESARLSLKDAGLELVEYPLVVASKEEAKECFAGYKKMDDLDAVVLFSGTWVWASHLIGAIRDFSSTGKGIVLWTHPGSQGWRPVGGLVMQGALKEIGIKFRFVYGTHDNSAEIKKIVSYCRASQEKNLLNMSTVGVFGGRGMGQTCGVADPSQWMRMFGIDIDSRDTTELLREARAVSSEEVQAARTQIQPYFSEPIPGDETAERSVRLYLALRKIMLKEGWSTYTIQSFPGLGDDYSATCFAQSMMLNDGVGTSTLSDFNTLLTSKLLSDLSSESVYYGDLQHINKANNEIKIIGDGACPPSLAGNLCPAGFAEHGIPTEGEAGGISVKLVCKPGEGVLARIGRNQGVFEMVITRCTVFEPPKEELEKRQLECGIPFWPHAFVTAHCDIDQLIQAWNNEYAVLGYGDHLYDELVDFCELTGIKAVAL